MSGGGFSSSGQAARESPDLSPDFVYQSKGRLTDVGYEVEIGSIGLTFEPPSLPADIAKESPRALRPGA